jgi:tight adherence protein B
MIALASGLLALAGVVAERSVVIARRADLAKRLGGQPAARRRRLGIPTPVVVGASAILVLLALGPSWAGIVVGAAFAGDRIVGRRGRRAAARLRGEQLADTVAAVAAGLRGGLSLSGSLAYARDEAELPMRDDLARLVGRIDVGVPIVVALGEWADQLGSEDARLLVGVLDLHHRSGGDLPSVLDGVVAALRERRAAHREVRALTAQARLSGLVLGTLPIGFFGFLMLTSRHEMLEAIATPLGRTAVGVGLMLELGAFFWIRRLLEVR